MNNNTLHDNFRKRLTNLHALTVLIVSLFETIAYAVLVHAKEETLSTRNPYFRYRVVLPILINVITHVIARVIIKKAKISRRAKNAIIISAALVTSLVVVLAHKEYIIICCAFVFPIILSSTFNDRKLLNASFLASLGILVCVGVAFEIEKSATLGTMINLMVLFGFAIVSYLCGRISISFSNENYVLIKEQAEKNDKLRDDVLRDQMTGLYNHNTFVSRLNKLVKRYEENKPFCIVMIDIDDFKKVNDTYGHDKGDEVLLVLAKELKEHCGETGTAFRYGGEEFAMIFEQKSIDETCENVNKMLEKFSKHKFGFTKDKLTFSAGVSEYAKGITADAFFELADQALYFAKKEGKNRIYKSK